MKISIGIGTWLGLLGAAAAVIMPLIGELADAAAPLGVSPAVWTVMGAILASVTVIGRMAQAVAVTIKEGGSNG